MGASKSNRRRGLFAVLAVGLSTGLCAAQTTGAPQAQQAEQSEATPTFRVSSHLAVTDVVVTDKRGMPIHGLTAIDFHVFENGVEQQIASFEEHTGSAGWMPTPQGGLPPDTYTNATSASAKYPLFVILLDSLNTAMSDQSFAQEELLKLVEGLPNGSRVAVFRLGDGLSMLQGFTEDAAELVATIKSKKASPRLGAFFNDPNLNLALNAPDLTAGMGGGQGGGAGHTMSLQDASEAGIQSDVVVSETIRALKALGFYLSQFPGRKNLVWMSGTFPVDIIPNTGGSGGESSGLAGSPDPFRGNRGYTIAIRDLALLLQSGNIAVYPVDVRGVLDNGLFNPASGSAGSNAANVASAAQTLEAFAGSNGQIHAIMQTIAHETGGRAYYNTNDLSGSMMEAFNDGSNYYSISYVPTDQKWDGQFRKIRLNVDREETKLYYRQGYYAEEPDKLKHSFPSPDSTIKTAMLRGSPAVTEITFRLKVKREGGVRVIQASAPVLKSREENALPHLTGPAVHYTIEYAITPSQLQFYSSAGSYRGRLTFSAIAYDADGKMLNADIGGFATPLSGEVYAAVQRDALHIRTGIDLPPGKVFLRVGVHDLTTNKIGAFEIPFEVNGETRAAK
jgi:VWFA-related protein